MNITAKEYFTLHKGERVYAGEGTWGALRGYHSNPNGFERLIAEVEIGHGAYGWTMIGEFDFIPEVREGSRYFYLSVPR